MPHVLFICTGNYYRSRFAEALTRHLVHQRALGWTVSSRGLWRGANRNRGSLSVHTRRELYRRRIAYADAGRRPLRLGEADLTEATLAIAVDEDEHRPMMERQFPAWTDRIRYWRVHDLNRTTSRAALSALAERVEDLVEHELRPSLTSP